MIDFLILLGAIVSNAIFVLLIIYFVKYLRVKNGPKESRKERKRRLLEENAVIVRQKRAQYEAARSAEAIAAAERRSFKGEARKMFMTKEELEKEQEEETREREYAAARSRSRNNSNNHNVVANAVGTAIGVAMVAKATENTFGKLRNNPRGQEIVKETKKYTPGYQKTNFDSKGRKIDGGYKY